MDEVSVEIINVERVLCSLGEQKTEQMEAISRFSVRSRKKTGILGRLCCLWIKFIWWNKVCALCE